VRLFKSLIVEKYPVYRVMVYASRARGTHLPDSGVDSPLLNLLYLFNDYLSLL